MTRLLSTAALLALLATPAAAFRAHNGLVVEPESATTFHVPYRGLAGAPAFWCAAADYARRELGLASSDRIWRLSEPPRRSGEGIRFSTRPEGAASDAGVFRFGRQGADLSVGHALMFCDHAAERRL